MMQKPRQVCLSSFPLLFLSVPLSSSHFSLFLSTFPPHLSTTIHLQATLNNISFLNLSLFFLSIPSFIVVFHCIHYFHLYFSFPFHSLISFSFPNFPSFLSIFLYSSFPFCSFSFIPFLSYPFPSVFPSFLSFPP